MSDAQYPYTPPMMDAHPIPEQGLVCPCQLSPVYILDMMFSAVLAMLPPGFLQTSLLAEHEELKSLWLGVSAAQHQLKPLVCY